MAQIAWWAWLGIGLFVAITAVLSGGKITWFAWIGLVFIVIGIGKVVALFVLNPKETKKEHQMVHPAPQQIPQAPTQNFCPRCRIAIASTDRYCRYCGWRLR